MKILETERLLLRDLETGDLDALAAIYGDPEVMKYIGNGKVFSREQTKVSIERWKAYQEKNGYSNWAVVDKAGGALIGKCGFSELPDNHGIEISYLFAKNCWGKGIASEISIAALDYGFKVLNLEKVIGLVYPQNAASIRVIEKMGMKFDKEAEFWGVKLLMYSKKSNEFRK